jgi:hypothetical protein
VKLTVGFGDLFCQLLWRRASRRNAVFVACSGSPRSGFGRSRAQWVMINGVER